MTLIATTPADVLEECRALGFELWAEGDSLRCRGPAGVMTAELRAALVEHKAAILAVLRILADLDDSSSQPEHYREHFEERAAILQFEAGFTRAESERKARGLVREMISRRDL